MKESQYPSLPVLLVDDERPWLRSLSFTLKGAGGIDHLIQCHESREVMEILARQEVSLILLDLTMPHLAGEELLPMITRDYPEIPVIILSGLNQVDTAVKCMRLGAFDYFVKTVETERLIAGIRRALAHQELQKDYRKLKTRLLQDCLEHPEAFSDMVTANRKIRSIFQYIEAVAHSTEPVLITGESGVGKELVAQALHRIGRPSGPWVAVNVAGLDEQVFADTLFGHTRGAFTGADQGRPGMIEQAGHGTLFLDEIGDLSPASQVKLLRFLQEGEYFPVGSDKPKRVKARIVCATNQDLAAKQASSEFRKDLYFRLCAHQVHIPPLRERLDDIPLLLDHFLAEASQALGKKKATPPEELAVLLATHHFPGNVRELRAMVYDAVSVHRAGKLSMDAFKKALGQIREVLEDPPDRAEAMLDGAAGPLFPSRLPTFDEAANLLVAEAMRRSKDNQTIAAGLLRISRQALSKRLKKSAR